MVKNRLTWVAIILVLLLPNVLCSPVSAYQGQQQRKPQSFVDRLIRRNPLGALARYISRNLPVNFYYEPAPRPQQMQPLYMPVTQSPTHYTKMTTMLTPVYFTPTMAMITPQPQIPQASNYMLHGLNYPVPLHPQQMPAVMSVIPQQTMSFSTSQVEAPHTYQQTQSTTTGKSGKSLVTLPTIVSSADEINEQSSKSGSLASLPNFPQVSDNMQIDGYEDASSAADDMLRIFVIRPRDLEKMKSSSAKDGSEWTSEYSTKYIDVEQRAQELVLRSTGNEGEPEKEKNSGCIEPLCDPFLRKLIPALLAPSSNKNEIRSSDDPILIVKNDTFHEEEVPNQKLETGIPENVEMPEFTVVKAVEEDHSGNGGETLQGNEGTDLKLARRARVHFPRRKFISAKLKNSKNVEKNEPPVSSKSSMSSKMKTQRIPRGSNVLRNQMSGSKNNYEKFHYAAGVLFNL